VTASFGSRGGASLADLLFPLLFPPTLISVTPSEGPTSGGTVVDLAGLHFRPGATVTFDGIAATGIIVVSSSHITATTPAHAAGPVNVTVTNPDAQLSTLLNGFSYGIPLIPDDAATVAHLWVSGGVIQDTKGIVWTETGAIPRIADAPLGAPFTNGKSAESIGPFSGANFLSTVAAALNLNAPYMVTVIAVLPPSASRTAISSRTANGGYSLEDASTTQLTATCVVPGFESTVSKAGLTAGSLLICSFGRVSNAGSTPHRIKVNLLAVVQNSPLFGYAPGGTTGVGINPAFAAASAWNAAIYEIRVNATDPTDVAMTALHTQVLTT
jgi:hypothetical protein